MKYAPNILDSALWREIVLANQSFERKGVKINKELEGEMGTHCLQISKNNFPVPVLTDETLTGTRLGKRTNTSSIPITEKQHTSYLSQTPQTVSV